MKILVVGGGTAGTIVGNNLARRLSGEIRDGKVKITMLSASDKHMYQPGLLYVAFGQMMPDQLYRDQKSLLESCIDFHWVGCATPKTSNSRTLTQVPL